jgi:prepilin-type N-terminal cleavage/methylation domain-containing protein
MERFARYNKKGMSLIEVMISLVILLFVSLAVMRTTLVGMNANLQNSMRDEAVNIVDLRMNELRDTAFDSINLGTVTGSDIIRTLRSATVTYTPTLTVASINANTKQLTLSVVWTYRGTIYPHSVTTIMRRQ